MKNKERLGCSMIAIYSFLVFVGMSCQNKLELPPSTQTGANSFGVKINSNVWLPRQAASLLGGPDKIYAEYTDNVVGIVARKGVNDEIITLTALDIKSPGIYMLNGLKNNGITETNYSGSDVKDKYELLKAGNNIIRITKLDTISKIIAGSFEMKLISENNKSILNFTKGTFDIKYRN